MNCPNCNAGAQRQIKLFSGNIECTMCKTIWSLQEGRTLIEKSGKSLLEEVPGPGEVL